MLLTLVFNELFFHSNYVATIIRKKFRKNIFFSFFIEPSDTSDSLQAWHTHTHTQTCTCFIVKPPPQTLIRFIWTPRRDQDFLHTASQKFSDAASTYCRESKFSFRRYPTSLVSKRVCEVHGSKCEDQINCQLKVWLQSIPY